MYTYLQRPVCKKENTTTYVHTGGVSNAYSRIRTARARVHGWVGIEKQRRRRVHGEATKWGGNGMRHVHREATERVGANRLGRNRRWNEAWCTAQRGKRTSYCRNGGPVDREGCGVQQNGGNGPPTVETGVLLIGRGVAYRKTEEMDLLRSKRGSC